MFPGCARAAAARSSTCRPPQARWACPARRARWITQPPRRGLQGLTLSVASDHAAEGIRCNCLIVGTVYTPLVRAIGEEGRERRRKAVPLQTEGTGWDVAYAAVYLASDESRWVTGVMLPIDGGFQNIHPWPR